MNINDVANHQDFLTQAALQQKQAPEIKGNPADKKTKEAVQDFEAFFISQMFEHMYATVPVNETFGGGNAEKIYRSMMIDEYGKMMAKAGGIGITDQIMAQLLQQQESAPALQSAPKTDGGSL